MNVDQALSNKITTEYQARQFLRTIIHLFGYSFHPDTSGDKYVNANGKPTFLTDEVLKYDERMREVFIFITDPYDESIKLWEKMLSR